jgi:hypothetical protein
MFLELLVLLLLLRLLSQLWYSRVIRGFQGLCLCIGFCMVWMLPELIYNANRYQPKDVTSFRKPVPAVDPAQPRLVWVVFDELSEDLLFDHRPGIEMPNFDDLRAEGVTFTDVDPEGYYTEDIFPSLLLGHDINDIRSSFNGDLKVHRKDTGTWQAWDESASIFGRAKSDGWTTGIAGWYNPYCRILANTLDRCAWDMEGIFRGHMSSEASSFENGMAPLLANFHRVRGKAAGVAGTPFGMHSGNYQRLMSEGLELVRDANIRFVLVHLPIPHPSGIYDRKTHRISPKGSYVDNMVLTDEALGAIREAIAGTASAGSTMLVVSSDHSWRVPLWRGSVSWTAEDERVSQGKFDSRSVLMVHFPGENAGTTVAGKFPGLNLHNLLQAMLKGEVRSSGALTEWASSRTQTSQYR